MSGIYGVTLAANASAQVPAMGSFVKVISAPSGSVQVKLDGGEGYSLLEGQGVRLPDGQTFRDVQVKNLTTLAQTVSIFVGDSRFEDSRITGVVTVIDSAKKRSRDGQAFIAPFTQIVAAAGQNPTLQAFNATNSGIVGYISKVTIYSGTAQLVRFGHNDTILATITGSPANKSAGGVAGSLICANESRAGTPPNFVFWNQYLIPANSTFTLTFDEPLVLPLGKALVLQGVTVATDLGGGFEYTQEAV